MTDLSQALTEPTPHQLATDQAHAYLKGGIHPTEDVMRWMIERLTLMTPTDLQILTVWLTGNERRIANSVDDLGMLESVFKAVVGRTPEHG